MALPTNTLLTICQSVAKNVGAYRNGTATGGSTTTLVSAAYPYKTSRTNASTRAFEGVEIRPSSGNESGNARSVDSYAPSTGTFTTGLAWGTGPANADTFDLYLRGVEYNSIKDCVNKALRERRYITVKPLSMLADADCDSSVTTSWSSSGTPTLSKVQTAGNLHRGTYALKMSNSSTSGAYVYQTIAVREQASYILFSTMRVVSGSITVKIYDASNAALITGATRTWDNATFIRRGMTFQTPENCYSIQVRYYLDSATANEAYLDNAILLQYNATRIALPDNLTLPGQVLAVCYDKFDIDNYAAVQSEFVPFKYAVIDNDEANPLGMYSVVLEPITSPIYVKVALPYTEMTTDSATTTMKRDWLETAATVELLSVMKSKAPTQEVIQWASQYDEWSKRLRFMDRTYSPKPMIFRTSTEYNSPEPVF